MEYEKFCSYCKIKKPLDDYPPDRRAKDGRQSKCRPCMNAIVKGYYRNNPAEYMLRRAKARAEKKGFKFNLSIEDITPLPTICPIFKRPLRIAASPHDPWSYSLDRIDNSKGYIKGNVVVMSMKANRLKNDGTAEEFEAIAAWLRQQDSL